MFSVLAKALKNMNSVPQSEVMWLGTLCFEKTCLTNSPASMTALIDLTVGMNITCLVSQSTTTRMSVLS